MNTYQTTVLENKSTIVKELNANVCVNSFCGNKGELKADLYYSSNSCPLLVAHNSCPPVNDTFIETVLITI